MLSVNTNAGALIALENLNNTSQALASAQNVVSTGLAIGSAKDNGAIWAIAQTERSTVSSLDAVKSSLQTGQSVIDVANSAGTTVSNLLTQMSEKALAASDTSLDTASRAALNNDFVALRNQITSTVQNASFNGVNLLNGSVTKITSLASTTGGSVLTTNAENLSLGGSIVTLSATATISTVATGIGNLVNADLAKESATLQALQTKQQLGIQALSIANSSSSALLGLFR